MRYLSRSLVALISLFSLSAVARDQPVTKEAKKIVALIASLKEVKKANAMMLKHNGHPLIIEIDGMPTKEYPSYAISVSEDLRETNHSFTIMRFCVHRKTYAISYWDVITDKQTPLKLWRKQGSKW